MAAVFAIMLTAIMAFGYRYLFFGPASLLTSFIAIYLMLFAISIIYNMRKEAKSPLIKHLLAIGAIADLLGLFSQVLFLISSAGNSFHVADMVFVSSAGSILITVLSILFAKKYRYVETRTSRILYFIIATIAIVGTLYLFVFAFATLLM